MRDEFIHIKCNNCGKKYKLKNPAEIKQYRCGGCGQKVIVEPVLFNTENDKTRFSGVNYERGFKRLAMVLSGIIGIVSCIIGMSSDKEYFGGIFGIGLTLIIIIWLNYYLIRFIMRGFRKNI